MLLARRATTSGLTSRCGGRLNVASTSDRARLSCMLSLLCVTPGKASFSASHRNRPDDSSPAGCCFAR
eukprot:1075205-Pleurochrysis_carterae.AAC.5